MALKYRVQMCGRVVPHELVALRVRPQMEVESSLPLVIDISIIRSFVLALGSSNSSSSLGHYV